MRTRSGPSTRPAIGPVSRTRQTETTPRHTGPHAAVEPGRHGRHSTRVDLTWTAGSDNVGVTNYEIFRGGSLLTMVGNVTSYSDTTVARGRHLQLPGAGDGRRRDRSTLSNTATVTTTDGSPPSQPTNLVATAAAYNRINLTWTASTDNVGGHQLRDLPRRGPARHGRGRHQLQRYGGESGDGLLLPGESHGPRREPLGVLEHVERHDAAAAGHAHPDGRRACRAGHPDDELRHGNRPSRGCGQHAGRELPAVQRLRAGGHASPRNVAGVGILRDWRRSRRLHEPDELDRDRDHLGEPPDAPGAGTDDKAGITTGTWVEYDVTTLMTGNGTWSFVLAGSRRTGSTSIRRKARTTRSS